jgi:hypothetical protein
MSIAATKWVIERRNIPISTRGVLLVIADMVNRKGEAWPTLATIADRCELSERMVQKHLVKASQLGAIIVKRDIGKRSTYLFPTPETYDGANYMTPPSHTSPTPELYDGGIPYKENRNGTVSSTTTGEENKELVLKILESLKALGIKPTKRMSGFITKFADKHNDLPLDWIDKAQKEINDRDIEQPWPYMKKMLTNWHKQGSPQNGLNGKRISQVVPEVEYVPGLTPSRLL